jgi:hypothetical protein
MTPRSKPALHILGTKVTENEEASELGERIKFLIKTRIGAAWLTGPKMMSELYSYLYEEVDLRLDEAARVGYGFVPAEADCSETAARNRARSCGVNAVE